MKKHRVLRWILSIVLLLSIFFGLFSLWIWHGVCSVPEFYQSLAVTPENRDQAEKDSEAMERKVRILRHHFHKENVWLLEFTQDEFNHWLAIAISEKRPGMVPRQLSDPRGVIFDDRIQAGVTVNTPEFHGIVSVELFPAISSPNTVDIEVKSITAGTINVPFKLFQSQIRDFAQNASLPIEVLNQDGRTILRVHLREGDLMVDDRAIEVQTISLSEKKILITGMVHPNPESSQPNKNAAKN